MSNDRELQQWARRKCSICSQPNGWHQVAEMLQCRQELQTITKR